jgi:type I restriction enzyme, R subunit
MVHPNEERFERYIEKLLNDEGYHSHLYTEYNRVLCLIGSELLAFIRDTQPEQYEKLQNQFGDNTDSKLQKRVNEEIQRRGIIDVLRNGVKTRGAEFDLVYFEPNSGLNIEHRDLYKQNRFVVVRQLHYSIRNENSIDMVLFLNGIPIITIELKNQLTGQNIHHSEKQYRIDRDPRELLLQFKRCLVHFCVDNDKVSMTTRLNGENTFFLPYNKGIENPFVPDGYRIDYMWREVLTPNSLLDIIQNFVLVSVEWDKVWDARQRKVVEKKKELLIFPRYHQLNVIRSLRDIIREEGVGNYYLIQHTTGSGKSYSIGWLSYLLTSLYRTMDDTNRMFDSVIVVTDRKVLDKQLQNTIKQLEQTQGVVNPIDINSQQLKEYLEHGKDIIITTIQKFPFISDTISNLKGQTFAVIVDEVHSSQSGETSKHLKKSLSVRVEDFTDEEGNIDYEEYIRLEIQSRGKQEHISFFGFTGTPKNKTLELFGRRNEQGQFVPFHSYSMKQSIAEGFTLDVLEHYITYRRWFKLKQKDGENRELPTGKVLRELMNFVDSHEEVIAQKVTIMLEQFTRHTAKKIGGKARAMVIVRSRKHCVLFQKEIVKQMRERGLLYSCLVAFSGSISYYGQEHTETSLNTENGLPKGVSIPEGLKDPRFRILIVSNKFQTGFDEPMVHTMFVDKKLGGVQCVQTLSRLNRTAKGKTDTFVLDFVNELEDVIESFQPFYTSSLLSGETDPDKLYNIETDIKGFNLYTQKEVDDFCQLFYNPSETDEKLQPILNAVVHRWTSIEDEDARELFRSHIQSYCRLYGYISQIISFEDVNLEKLFVFLKYLNKKLPKGTVTKIDLGDAVDLDSLRIQKIGEQTGKLVDTEGVLEPPSEYGAGIKPEEEVELLSEIINRVNELYGIELTDEDKLDLENVHKRMVEHEEVKEVMQGNNSEQDKKDFFNKILTDMFIEYVNDRFDFYKKVEDPNVNQLIKDGLYRKYLREVG